MSRAISFVLAFTVCCHLQADDKSITLVVKTADGKPVPGAKAWVYPETFKDEVIAEVPPVLADAFGKFTVNRIAEATTYKRIFVRDDAGRIGMSFLQFEWDESEKKSSSMDITLIEMATVNGRVTTPDGKPIVGAMVIPTEYTTEIKGERIPGSPFPRIPIPAWEQSRLTVKSDALGHFKLPAPAKGYAVSYRVKAEGFGESKWHAPLGLELETPLAQPATITIGVSGMDATHLKSVTWRLNTNDDPKIKSKSVGAIRQRNGTFDGQGIQTIRDVAPGQYTLAVESQKNYPGVFEKPVPFEVTAGKTTDIPAKFGPAANVTGKIADKNGKGVPRTRVYVMVNSGSNSQRIANITVETNAEGQYTAYGPAGWYSIWLDDLPDGFALPVQESPKYQLVSPIHVDAGKSEAFRAISLLDAVTFSAKVFREDHQPAIAAEVRQNSRILRRANSIKTDQSGQFTLPNLSPDDSVSPRVRLGKAVNVPQTYELAKAAMPVEIELSEKNAVTLIGRIVDGKGNPIANANVEMRQLIMGVGRNSRTGSSSVVAKAKTEQDGRFTFNGWWQNDTYQIMAKANGFSQAEGSSIRGIAGQTQDFGDIKLTRASLVVKGIVVGPDAKPMAGVELFGVDGPSRFTTTSLADGSFTLSGYYEGPGFLFAKKARYRLVAKPIIPGDERIVRVELANADGSPVPPPVIPPNYPATLDAYARHSLTQIWNNRDTFRYGANALANMALIDLPTAKAWRDEEFNRTEGKTDYNSLINRTRLKVTLFETATKDSEAALTIIAALKPNFGFVEAQRIAQLLLPIDKAESLRFAEQAIGMARQLDMPNQIYSLAMAGDLAILAGGKDIGKITLMEAAELAAELEPDVNGRNSLAIGMTAAHLAPHDGVLAEDLLNRIKSPEDYNRYLADTASNVARTDLAKAKKMLGRFKPTNTYYPQIARAKVAGAAVSTNYDEAVKMVESIDMAPYRVLGYVHLARLTAPTDKTRAVKLIDTAFDLLERDPIPFSSWMNYGGRISFAAIALVRAKELGHPDVPQLIARFLAMRPSLKDAWSPKDHEKVTVNLAACLALIDPDTARNLLATLGKPKEYEAKALTQDRSWLFALALTDPERAIPLADKLLERELNRKGGNRFSQTGLVELGSILVSQDRLKELTSYGHLPREIDDE